MTPKRMRNFLLPPPAYLLMPAVGVDVSDRSIKYAKLIADDDGYELGSFGEMPLPAGIVESGQIVDAEKLSSALRELKKNVGLSFVRAALPEEQVYFFR